MHQRSGSDESKTFVELGFHKKQLFQLESKLLDKVLMIDICIYHESVHVVNKRCHQTFDLCKSWKSRDECDDCADVCIAGQ